MDNFKSSAGDAAKTTGKVAWKALVITGKVAGMFYSLRSFSHSLPSLFPEFIFLVVVLLVVAIAA